MVHQAERGEIKFEDFMSRFRSKHPEWFGSTQTHKDAISDVRGAGVAETQKTPAIPPGLVPSAPVVAGDWDGIEDVGNWWDK